MWPWMYLKKYLALYRPLRVLRKKSTSRPVDWSRLAIVQKGSRHAKIIFIFFSLEFNWDHFKPIPDEKLYNIDFRSVLVKSAKSSMINFDSTPGGRNEVQKNEPKPYCLTEFHEESKKNNHYSPRELTFWAKMVFKNN
jgi:hypothetical protein